MGSLLLVFLICAAFANDLKSTPLDDELKSMSQELDTMDDKQQKVAIPVPKGFGEDTEQQQPAKPEMHEKEVAGATPMTMHDVKRFIDLGPNEQIALVQSNVGAKIIATAPGDRLAVLPLQKKTTPCPESTTKKPQTHMYCNSCGKKNPPEEGVIASYLDIESATSCAQMCAQYLAKGQRCSVWEYHGEWRNKQCFILYLPDFPACTGQLGVGSLDAFQSGTCVKETIIPGEKKSQLTDFSDLDAALTDDGGLPANFPHVEVSSSIFQENKVILSAAFGSVLLFAGVFYYASRKTHSGYEALAEEI